MGFMFQMGMAMKSLKWEVIGTKNLFPHTSSADVHKGQEGMTKVDTGVDQKFHNFVHVFNGLLLNRKLITLCNVVRGSQIHFSGPELKH